MKTTKNKTFHYKKASFNNDSDGFSLQELIEEAYNNTSTAFDCAYSFQQDGENYHLINYFSANHKKKGIRDVLLGAEFLSYVKGNDPILINTAKTARELPLEASNLSKEGKEAIEGAIYFGVVDNDVVLTQSMVLRVQALEKYLNWLIAEKGTLWTKDNYVGLIDPGLSPQKRKKAGDEAREITILAPVQFRPIKPSAETKDYKVKASGVGIDAIKALFAKLPEHEKFVDEFKVEDFEMSRSLEIELRLRWTGRRDDPKPYDLMEQVSRQFRHVTDEFDYSVETEDGMTITKDQIKRSLSHSISWAGARPVFDDLFPKMLQWLGEIRT
jgi:hypothetical protein